MKPTPRSTRIKLTGSIIALGLFLGASIITIPILYRSTENRSAATGINKPPKLAQNPNLCDPNGDGRSDGLDYALIYTNYGSQDPYAIGDCNADGKIDGLDLTRLYEDWRP
jgi:hypothetical protein